MALSKKFLTRLAIGVAVAIVVLFIVWKIRNKSKYTVDSLKTGAAGTLEGSFYSNVSNCQNTFTLSTLGNVMVFSDLTCDKSVTPNKVIAKTLVPHKYTGTSTVYIQGASSDGSTTGSTFGYNTKQGVPVTVTPDATDVRKFTYPAIDGSCSVAGGTTPALSQFGYSYLSTDTPTAAANAIRETCISSNVQTYMENKCKWTLTGNTPTAGADKTAYEAYQENLKKVKDAYANIILTAPEAPTATKASKDQIQAAREADFTAATRMYLNAVCPGYYAQTTGVDPGIAAVAMIPNSPYNAYVADTAATTGVNGFNKTLITDANILNWSRYVSTQGADGNFSDANPPLTASTAAGDPTRYKFKTLTPGTTATFASGLSNWQIAQDIGPGTVTMSGTIPGTKTAAGAAVTSSLVMNSSV